MRVFRKHLSRFWDSTHEQHLALEFIHGEVGEFLQQQQEQNPATIFIYHNVTSKQLYPKKHFKEHHQTEKQSQ